MATGTPRANKSTGARSPRSPRSPNSTAMLALLRQYHMDEDDLVRACLPSTRPTSRPCSCAPVCPRHRQAGAHGSVYAGKATCRRHQGDRGLRSHHRRRRSRGAGRDQVEAPRSEGGSGAGSHALRCRSAGCDRRLRAKSSARPHRPLGTRVRVPADEPCSASHGGSVQGGQSQRRNSEACRARRAEPWVAGPDANQGLCVGTGR